MNYKDKFVGIKIHGFCNGYFGRDSYDDKIIIASGENWIVAKCERGINWFSDIEADEMEELIQKWNKGNEEY
uniref:Phage protein n=1 Tax=Bacillus phage Jabberwock TaxID=3163548 RepID=A0AAU8EHD8_9CAUD